MINTVRVIKIEGRHRNVTERWPYLRSPDLVSAEHESSGGETVAREKSPKVHVLLSFIVVGSAMKKLRKPTRKPTPGKRWVRLSPAARVEAILSEAIIFFAEHGFEAQTRDLASRIGVSQALIYRYFRTKADLIEAVYQRFYMSRWNALWEKLLADRRIPLEQRLKEFYKSYLSTFDDYAWIRVSVYSGLRDNNLVSRYIDRVIDRVIRVISVELRHECGLPAVAPADIPKLDLELSWNYHSAIIYFLMRRYVFQKPPCDDNDAVVEQMIDQLFSGTVAVLQRRHQSSAPLKLLRRP